MAVHDQVAPLLDPFRQGTAANTKESARASPRRECAVEELAVLWVPVFISISSRSRLMTTARQSNSRANYVT